MTAVPSRAFAQVDVFTGKPWKGNPVAVVLDGSGVDEGPMQAFTDWTNLSEATFLLPPSDRNADYRLRIFCPGRELPFAGHPTLGSCHAWLEAGGRPRGERIVQECGAGLVEIRRDGARLAFAAPPLVRSGPLSEEDVLHVVRAFGLERGEILRHAWVANGPQWCALWLESPERLLSLRPEPEALAGWDVGFVAPLPAGGECAFEVRAFFSGNRGLTEDPVTGSLNAGLAVWLIGEGLAPATYVVSQGTALARAGRVHVERDATGTIWVGGECVTCIEGSALF